MNDRPRIGRDALMLIIGAAIGALFGVFVAYPELVANSKENAARIESNQQQIELLWEAHQIEHEAKTEGGTER